MRRSPIFLAAVVAAGLAFPFMNPLQAAQRSLPLDAGFLRDYAGTRGFRLGRPTAVRVTPDGDAVLFLRSGPRSAKQALYQYDRASGGIRELITPERLLGGAGEVLSPEEKARRERMRVSVGGFTSYDLSEDGKWVLAPLGGRLFLIERATAKARELPIKGGAFDAKLSPDGTHVGYVREHDVHVLDVNSGRGHAVTRGGSESRPHGEAEFVAAEEMDRYTGWWWSPDSRSILFQETDTTGVEVWHVADPARPDQAPRAQYYPRPGKSNVAVRLGVVGRRGGRVRWLAWDRERYPYFARADWHAAGGLTIQVQSRDQKELVLLRVDPASGRTSPLLVETDAAWVNLDPQMPKWLGDGSGFLWTSERSGRWELELRRADGSPRGIVVSGDKGYQGLSHLDEAGGSGTVVVAASTDPTETRLFRAPLDGMRFEALTPTPGLHAGVFGRKSELWVHTWTTPDRMNEATVQRMDGSVVAELPSVAEDPGFVPGAEVVRVGEGEGFYAQVVRPTQFDLKRKYPVLMSVYGGPHVNVVQAAMPGRLLAQWMADQGFVVVTVENRGTPRRGRAWERAIHQRLGEVPLADQVAGLQALGARFPELDLGRVGIVGWSFGGYMGALAVLRRPDVFHAAVAGAPVTDWLDYDTHYTERYLGVPGSGDAVYAANSLIADAPKLERPLLLIHGTSDDNVFFRHSLKLADALFRAGRPFEILPLPGLTHMVPDPVVMERQWTRTTDFFRRSLGVLDVGR